MGTQNYSFFSLILLTLAVIVAAAVLVTLLSRLVKKLVSRERQALVQIAEIDQVKASAQRNARITQGGSLNMGSAMVGNLGDYALVRLYRLDKNHKKMTLRVQASYVRELKEGDTGRIRYRGGEVTAFEKTGSGQS